MIYLRKYFAILTRWWWLILLGAVAASGTAFIISANTTPVYRASARYLIDQAPGTDSGTDYAQLLAKQRLAQTYAEIMTTRPILEGTIAQLNLPYAPGQLANNITVVAQQDTQVLRVSVEDTDSNRAAEIANTLGQVFIIQNQERESQRYSDPIANWQETLATEETEIGRLNTALATIQDNGDTTSILERQQLQLRLSEAQDRYNRAFEALSQLQVDQVKESSNIVSIEQASIPSNPIRPRTLVNTLLAFFVGAAIALGIVVIAEYMDDTIKSSDEVQADTKIAPVGAIPAIVNASEEISNDERKENLAIPVTERSVEKRLIAFHEPRSPITEAYRMLRTNLGFASIDEELTTLLVTSASPGEGKSTTAGNLAVVMAQLDERKVILVDADLRKPTQHRLFQIKNNFGLSTAIIDKENPVTNYLQETRVPNLRILTSGSIPINPAELLNSKRMIEVINELKSHADLIIFDTPPVLAVADASILAPNVVGSILVAQVAKTKHGEFKEAIKRLTQSSNTKVLGFVMNQTNAKKGYYYNYHAKGYYGKAYGDYGMDRPNGKKGKSTNGRFSRKPASQTK